MRFNIRVCVCVCVQVVWRGDVGGGDPGGAALPGDVQRTGPPLRHGRGSPGETRALSSPDVRHTHTAQTHAHLLSLSLSRDFSLSFYLS